MADKDSAQSRLPEPIGLMRLIEDLRLSIPPPAVRSEAVAGARRTKIADGKVIEDYPRSYAPQSLIGQLKFAMRYEPIDLAVLKAAFRALDTRTLVTWIREEQTGVFARRAWYLYEFLTGETPMLP